MLGNLKDYVTNNKYLSKFVNNKYAFYGCIGYTVYFFGSIVLARIVEGMKQYNSFTTANYILKDKDFTDKTGLITGGSAGLGKETCKLLVGKGMKIYMVVRNIEKAQNAKDDIINALNKKNINIKDDAIVILKMDLSSLQSVYDCAYKILKQRIKIDYLINNAGVILTPIYTETTDGYEEHFGINHLGHYYFTKLLMPLLIEHKTRIINISSAAYLLTSYKTHVKLLKYAYESKSFMGKYKNTYNRWTNYGVSKACNIIFTRALNKEYSKKGIISLAVHPGSIVIKEKKKVASIPGTQLPLVLAVLLFVVPYSFAIEYKDMERGLSTLMRCITMTDNDIQSSPYIYYQNCNPVKPHFKSLASSKNMDNTTQILSDLSDVLITHKGFNLKIQLN